MTCIWINDQLTVFDFLMHDIRVLSWNLHILITVDNQGWLRDKGHIVLWVSSSAI